MRDLNSSLSVVAGSGCSPTGSSRRGCGSTTSEPVTHEQVIEHAGGRAGREHRDHADLEPEDGEHGAEGENEPTPG